MRVFLAAKHAGVFPQSVTITNSLRLRIGIFVVSLSVQGSIDISPSLCGIRFPFPRNLVLYHICMFWCYNVVAAVSVSWFLHSFISDFMSYLPLLSHFANVAQPCKSWWLCCSPLLVCSVWSPKCDPHCLLDSLTCSCPGFLLSWRILNQLLHSSGFLVFDSRCA